MDCSTPWLSLSPGACSDSCPLSQWCHPTISSSAAPFSFCHQSFPASGSFPMRWLFASGGQCTVVSAIVLPMIYINEYICMHVNTDVCSTCGMFCFFLVAIASICLSLKTSGHRLCFVHCSAISQVLVRGTVYGILQARILEWLAIPFLQGIFLTQGLNLGLLHCRQILYHLSHQGNPYEALR